VKKLDRSLGLTSVVGVSVSAMIGSGIFVLPGLAAERAGPSVWLAYVLAAIAVLPAALSKSELATAMPTSGGSYVFLDRCFGPLWGTVAGVALWLSLVLKSAFALVGMVAYSSVFTSLPGRGLVFGVLAGIVTLNVLGVRKVGKALVGVAALTVAGLAALIASSVPRLTVAHFDAPLPEGVMGVVAAAGLVFASYNGVTKVASVAGEVERPERNLPAGILLSLGLVTVLYAAVSIALVGVLSASGLAGDTRPVHSLAVAVGGHAVGVGVAALGVVTLASMANAGMLAGSRYPFAMSRGKVMPPLLGKVSARFATPVASVLLTGALMAAIILLFDVAAIAKLASATVLSIFIAENVAVLVFHESRASWYRPRFRSPLYPWTQFAGIVASLALLVLLGWIALLGIAASLVPGLLLYAAWGRGRTDRRGMIGMLSRRSRDAVERRSLVPEPVARHGDEPNPTAAVVVALLGEERSPEILAELGGALAEDQRTEVIDLQQVHDELLVDREDDGRVHSLRRRIAAVGETIASDLGFQVLLTRDPPGTLDRLVADRACRWVVMEWQTRGRRLLAYNPLGWMLDHIDANVALFRDVGVRYVREILVVTEGDALDPLVLDTADHLASVWKARVTLARWLPTGASDDDVAQARAQLALAAEACAGVEEQNVVVSHDEVAAFAEASARYDLMILSRPRTSGATQLFRRTWHERIATASACSVLLLQPPPRVVTTSDAENLRERITEVG